MNRFHVLAAFFLPTVFALGCASNDGTVTSGNDNLSSTGTRKEGFDGNLTEGVDVTITLESKLVSSWTYTGKKGEKITLSFYNCSDKPKFTTTIPGATSPVVVHNIVDSSGFNLGPHYDQNFTLPEDGTWDVTVINPGNDVEKVTMLVDQQFGQ